MEQTNVDVRGFIESTVESPRKKEDAYRLLGIFEETSGFEARMWGPSIIGFGSYHYVYESGHEGDAPLVGFSPRKAKISLYVSSRDPEDEPLLDGFGKYTYGKSCLYINKLDDIDVEILKKLIVQTIGFLETRYPRG